MRSPTRAAGGSLLVAVTVAGVVTAAVSRAAPMAAPSSPAGPASPASQPSAARTTQSTPRAEGTPGPFQAEVARAEQAMQVLQAALLARLKAELDRGGPLAAVKVCRNEAQALTEKLAREQGFQVGRTSHRLRNPANAPRSWMEPAVRAGAGRKAAELSMRVVDLGDRVGVLRPIGTAEICTRCHGAHGAVEAAIGTMLAATYPEDAAMGFAVGDLRGWMWAEVPKR